MNRENSLNTLRARSEPWDVVIVGGGATGAGCCLDAASRGLNVLLVEKEDFGTGTSSRSTKLIHGGVRYLEQGNLRLVRESLIERGRLFENAPHLIRKQEFVVPCQTLWESAYYTAGLKLYDLLSGKLKLGKSKYLSRRGTLKRLPSLDSDRVSGGVSYFDGQFDDTKLLLSILRTASSTGATILNYAKVKNVLKTQSGKVNGISFECLETGAVFEPMARVVINATGSFTDKIRKLSDADSAGQLTFSQGTHLVFDGELLGSQRALLVPKTSDERVLFAIPFYGKTLVGTTDTPVEGPEPDPRAVDDEIDFLLETCADFFKNPPRKQDIKSVFTGIRPLVSKKDGTPTPKISRRHAIEVDNSGLVTITGGKWTTYRLMAEDTVNIAAKTAGLEVPVTDTANMRLEGDPEFDSIGLTEKLSEEFEWTVADVVKAVRFDMARTVEDVLARRTRILFLDASEAILLAPFISELVASELGRDAGWAKQQTDQFKKIAAGYLPDIS